MVCLLGVDILTAAEEEAKINEENVFSYLCFKYFVSFFSFVSRQSCDESLMVSFSLGLQLVFVSLLKRPGKYQLQLTSTVAESSQVMFDICLTFDI